jgi:hypothetical protein
MKGGYKMTEHHTQKDSRKNGGQNSKNEPMKGSHKTKQKNHYSTKKHTSHDM